MRKVQVRDLLPETVVLASRSTADQLHTEIMSSIRNQAGVVCFDLSGMTVVSPSFLDQLFLVVEYALSTIGSGAIEVAVIGGPPGMHGKLETIARAHDAELFEVNESELRLSLSARPKPTALHSSTT